MNKKQKGKIVLHVKSFQFFRYIQIHFIITKTFFSRKKIYYKHIKNV